jgi:predicted ribosome quality control (RQC) complex YloA/Tae2 family protein
MKQKMTAIDVRALVLILRRKLVGLRMANVYDVSGRLYLLKLSKANRKEHLLIEAGIRIHTTEFLRNKKDVPSGFTMKLRKHMRTKKLEKVEQLGIDRVVDLQFGKSEFAFHILVELYAAGNVILTDHEYTILSLLRSHKFDETAKIQIKEKYPFTAAAGMTIDSITTDPETIKKFISGTDLVPIATTEISQPAEDAEKPAEATETKPGEA